MAQKFIGITLPVRLGQTGMFDQSTTVIQQVRSNFKNLILTKKGERLMQPDFGCDVWKVLFEPIDNIEISIENSIINAVSIWLPYLNINEIIFDYDENDIDTNKVSLDIKFSLQSNPSLSDSVQINVEK